MVTPFSSSHRLEMGFFSLTFASPVQRRVGNLYVTKHSAKNDLFEPRGGEFPVVCVEKKPTKVVTKQIPQSRHAQSVERIGSGWGGGGAV